MARLEAILFLAKEPLNSRKLAQLANLADGTEARTLIRSLNRLYDAAHRSFRVEELAGGYQLLTRAKFADWVRRVTTIESPTRLSSPALETLAIIAYRQPVIRADVEAIRGVNCGEIIRQLMDRDLVQIRGRSEELGRPYLYSTTSTFLRTFGFRSLNELPRKEEFRRIEAGTEASAAKQLDDQKEPSVSITIASHDLTSSNREEAIENTLGVSLGSPAGTSTMSLPIEDEEEELYESDEFDEDADDADDDDEEDDYDEDWDDDYEDDDFDDDDADDDDADEGEWEEVEDDDFEEEDADDFDDDDEEDNWDDDEEEDE